jgi:hypothetical protein
MSKKGVRLIGDNQEGMVSLGTDAWNSAEGYAKIKILRLLVLLDKYEDIALYGTSDIDDFVSDPSGITQRREEGLRRFLTTMRQLLGNCKFAMKKEHRPKVEKFMTDIDFVENRLSGLSTFEQNFVTGESYYKIDENYFSLCYRILRDIKDELNFPINASGLIFRENEEMDLDKIMNDIITGG